MRYVFSILLLVLSCAAAALQSNLPLDQAARDGKLAEVKHLIEAGANPNELNKWGTSALTGASGGNSPSHTEIAQFLVTHGADVNKRVADGTTALNEASFWGNIATVRILLAAKADVNAEKDNGYTPLLSAASRGHIQIVKLLIEAGANLNQQTRVGGLTALHLASSAGYRDIVNLLIAAGARQDIRNIRGETYSNVAGRTKSLRIP
jgi:ankyrin repeat protein